MKLKLNQLHPNPFKKEINGGHLDKEQVKRIKSNIKELGLMGSLPVFKKDGKYYLVSGHHRLQALKETYGNNFEIEVILHNYNKDQVIRGMVVENLTQRTDDFREINTNLVMIRNNLISGEINCPEDGQLKGEKGEKIEKAKSKRKDGRGGRMEELGSIRNVERWLNKNGEVLKHSIIAQHMSIYDNLDKELYEKVEKTHKGDADKRTDGETISFIQAEMLSRIKDKKEQKVMSEVLLNSREQRVREQGKLLTAYKEAPEPVKKAIRERKIDLTEVAAETHKAEVGEVNLDRNKVYLESHIELREKLSALFAEKMFLKQSPQEELEKTYHYLLNWVKKDLVPFMKAIEEEYKSRGKEKDIVFFDLTERRSK